MPVPPSTKAVAYAAAVKIKRVWDTHPLRHLFHPPKVSVHPGTYEIITDMVNGYPPRKLEASRGRVS